MVAEEEKAPAEAVLKFKGKPLLVADGTRLHYTPLEELIEAICFSFQDVCQFSSVIGWDKEKNLAYRVDCRDATTKKRCKEVLHDYLKGYIHDECTTLFHMPAKFIASAFLEMYDEMALEYEGRKANRDRSIIKN